MCGGGDSGSKVYRQQKADEKKRQKKMEKSVGRLNLIFGYDKKGNLDPNSEAFKSRDQLYAKTGNDVKSYFADQLNKDREDNTRIMRFDLARRGVAGGSADIDAMGELGKTYDKGMLEVAQKGIESANRLRDLDNQTRRDLISQIYSGVSGNAANSQAYSTLANNANTAKDAALNSGLTTTFGDALNLYKARQENKARADADRSIFSPSSGGRAVGSSYGSVGR